MKVGYQYKDLSPEDPYFKAWDDLKATHLMGFVAFGVLFASDVARTISKHFLQGVLDTFLYSVWAIAEALPCCICSYV